MANNRNWKKGLRTYFSQDVVPPEIHSRIVQTCRQLPSHPRPPVKAVWRRVTAAVGAVLTVFGLLCGLNAVNPAFAESIPLIGRAFRLYNTGKTSLGSYMGTYDGVEKLHYTAQAFNTNLSLTVEEGFCDGEYIHLTFAITETNETLLDGLTSLDACVTAAANGIPLEEAGVSLYPEQENLIGVLSLPLPSAVGNGDTVEVTYQLTDLTRVYDGGSAWEAVPGSFTGSISLTAVTEYNQQVAITGDSAGVEVHTVEATPSYTKIEYTIPFWGFRSYTVDFPRLFLPDGTPVPYNLSQSQVPSPDDIPRDATEISGSACFDGLPSGTQQVILRFLEEDLDPYTAEDMLAHGMEVRVLAEITIDLRMGKSTPSTTYQDAGMTFAGNYLETYPSLSWMMPFDDPDMIALGQADWDSVTSIPGLFEQGNSLWALRYQDAFTVEFVTDGPAPAKDLTVTISTEDGQTAAQGTLRHNFARETHSGGDLYYSWKANLQPQSGYAPSLLDTLTVSLTDPTTGNTLYQRSVRLVWAR